MTATFLSGDGSLDAGWPRVPAAPTPRARSSAARAWSTRPASPSEQSKKFVDAYKAEFNTDPAIYSAEGYDAATAFIEAIKAGNTDPEAINEYLSTVDVPGVSKQIKFGENGEPAGGDVFVYQFEGGATRCSATARRRGIS